MAGIIPYDVLAHIVAPFLENPYTSRDWRKFARVIGSKFLLLMPIDYWHLPCAVKARDRDTLNILISRGARDWNAGMAAAARIGDFNFVSFFISKGAKIWNRGMHEAARGGHRFLVDFFISKGANDFLGSIHKASRGGHLDLINFFIPLVQNITPSEWDNSIFEACRGGHFDLVKHLIPRGTGSWDRYMKGASMGGHFFLLICLTIGYARPRWNKCMRAAASRGHHKIVILCALMGADDFDTAAEDAQFAGYEEMMNFLIWLESNDRLIKNRMRHLLGDEEPRIPARSRSKTI